MERKRIFFITPHLGGGGAERVLSTVLKYLDRERFDPWLILYSRRISYDLPSDVKIIDLGMDASGRGILKKAEFFIRRIFRIKAIIERERPHAVMTMLAGPIPILSCLISRNKPKIVVRETTFPSLGLFGPMGLVHKILLRIFYPLADDIIALTNEARMDLVKNFGVPLRKVTVIQNPIDLDYVRRMASEPLDRGDARLFSGKDSVIISVGRLYPKKGYQYLLRAFSLLIRERRAKLLILGEGPYEKNLRRMASGLDISDRVHFMGFRTNPFKYVRNSDIFVFPSLYEGFPNVLLEAMACGAPVISTDCTSGPRDIIEPGKSGVLVPIENENALFQMMKRLIDDHAFRKRLSEGGSRRVENFTVERALKNYENVFLS
jgi:glycosyltransferase involved in cell wall biosynthesis